MSKCSLRPHKSGQSDLKDVYKIFVSKQVYNQLRPNSRDFWTLEDDKGTIAIGKLAQAHDEVQHKVVQVTHEFKDLFGLSFSDSYILKKSDTQARHATELVLVEETIEGTSPLNTSDLPRLGLWQGVLHISLVDKLVSPTLRIEHVQAFGETRSFRIKAIINTEFPNGLNSSTDLHTVSKVCTIRIEDPTLKGNVSGLQLDRSGFFGLDEQLDTLDEMLGLYGPLWHDWDRIKCARLLLVGPVGSDTSLIADRISNLSWTTKTTITESEIGKYPTASLPRIFADCSKNQPSLIRIQHFQRLLTNLGADMENALIQAFEIIAGMKVLVLAEAEHTEISSELLDWFSFKIHVASPDENARRDFIMYELDIRRAKIQSATGIDSTTEVATIVSQKTPGYTRSKLQILVEKAIFYAHLRLGLTTNRQSPLQDAGSSFQANSNPGVGGSVNPTILYMMLDDFEKAIKKIPPLAKNQTSKHSMVRWSDIGGQQETKEIVERLFEWPLKYPEKFETLGLRPGKGLLLYGPPGCSKTMTALALATEAKLNFIAIKGPELLSKYVGESEQNLRDVFARARSMAPCVIFFDEVDSIGSSGGSAGESRGGINLVTTLLNEMDGVDDLKGVSVLAATNKPWELDQALLRPGRFDGMVYVNLPDAKARREIIQIRLGAMLHNVVQYDTIDMEGLVDQTEGCSGAEVVDLCRNAAMEALQESIHLASEETKLTGRHFEKASLQLRRDTSPDMIASFDAFANRSRRT